MIQIAPLYIGSHIGSKISKMGRSAIAVYCSLQLKSYGFGLYAIAETRSFSCSTKTAENNAI